MEYIPKKNEFLKGKFRNTLEKSGIYVNIICGLSLYEF